MPRNGILKIEVFYPCSRKVREYILLQTLENIVVSCNYVLSCHVFPFSEFKGNM